MLWPRRVPAFEARRRAAFAARGGAVDVHGLSKAWTVVRNAEDGLGFHLLTSTAGGKHGGGAELTDEARQMIAAYDAYCEKLRAYGVTLFEETFAFYNDIPKHELHRKEKTHD